MMERKCENCEWWDFECAYTQKVFDDKEIYSEYGECHRYPPINGYREPCFFDEDDEEGAFDKNNVFPIMATWNWCGEFKPKEV